MPVKAHPELDYGFVPNRHGMHSGRLVSILDNLKDLGLVCMEKTAEGQRNSIHLTEAGREIADCLTCCNPDVLTILRGVKSTLNRLSYNELVAPAYAKFPEMREKSEQADKYEEWGKAAPTVVRDGKIEIPGSIRRGLERGRIRRQAGHAGRLAGQPSHCHLGG